MSAPPSIQPGFQQPMIVGGQQPFAQTAPQGYVQTAPQGYVQTAPQGYVQTAPQGYAQTAPQGYAQTAPQGYVQTAPQGYVQTAPQGYVQTTPQGYVQTAPVAYTQPAPVAYAQPQAPPPANVMAQSAPQPQAYAGAVEMDDLNFLKTLQEKNENETTWEAPEPKKDKRAQKICVQVLGSIFATVTFIIACVAFAALQEAVDDFEDIINTWQQTPITEIKYTNGQCESGWSAIDSYTWPGTYNACNCFYNSSMSNDYDSSCSSEEREYSCRTVSGYPSVNNIQLFPDTDASLCYKRSGQDALERMPPMEDGQCPTDHHLCGSDSETPEGYFCIANGADCPLTDMVMLPSSEIPGFAYDGSSTFAGASLTAYWKAGGVLDYSYADRKSSTNNVDSIERVGYPIVYLKMQSYFPCKGGDGRGHSGRTDYSNQANKQLQSVTPSYGGFTRGPVRASPDYGCDRGAERRHTEVYARREKDILSPYKVSNGGGIPDNYVDYTGDDYHFFLTFMPEVQWNVECPHDRTKVSNAENDVQDLHDAQLAMLVISIFTFILITLVGSFIMVKIFQNDDDGTIEEGEDGYEFQQKYKYLSYAFKAGTLICIIVSMVTAINMAYIFQEISESGEEAAAVCTDVVSASSLSTLSSSITKISNEDIVAGCSSGFDVLMEIIDKVMFC